MSIFIGIAILFGVMFAIFSGAVGGDMSAERHPHLGLRVRPDPTQPDAKAVLLLEGSGFEPDSEVRFVAWYLPDGRGSNHKEPVESLRHHKFRSSSFDDVAFEPAISRVPFVGEGEPHDIKVIATDERGNAAEAWISGKDFYLPKESGVVA